MSHKWCDCEALKAELAEAKRERDALRIKVASPDCMGCAHRDRAGEMIRKLEAEVEELSEENQQLVADNIGYRDQIAAMISAREFYEEKK